MKTYIHILVLSLCLSIFAFATACSTQKNTGVSRTWHELKVIHNVQFNGEQAFKEGMATLNQSHQDNFSSILPLYPVSDHKAAEASASSMEKAIDKCRKSIKLHSIKARPKVNPKKRDNVTYQNWLKNQEFNSQMYRAWFMLGKSEFHKGDFLGSVGTFRYIEKLYENDPNMVALCELWTARAYGEMGWQYEAEDILSKVKVDDLKRKNEAFYSAVSADIRIKGGHYKEAIPFVKIAKENEKRKEYLPRFEYVLAQLYQRNNQKAEARSAYKRVFRLHPKDVSMEFNARLHYAELKGDTIKTMKQLRQMTRLYKYRDQLDQLYGIMGNIYLMNRDTAQALNCYHQGIEASTKNGYEKGIILITAGDLYYSQYDYANASPCYHEAVQIITAEHPDYKRISHRSEVLDEVVVEIGTIQLQDSLQRLGHLSEEEQLLVVEKIIADLKEKEKQDSISQVEQVRAAELDAQGGGLQSVNLSKMVGNRTGDAANWYFYNPSLLNNGKHEFIQKWGNRALEDNWRRMSKAVSTPTNSIESVVADSTRNDSTSTTAGNTILSTDIYSTAYYLQQIPKTTSDYEASDAKIADAMFNLVYLYRDKVGDQVQSDRTFADFISRFSKDERVLDLYYDRYLNALRIHNNDTAAVCRKEIIARFPESMQAQIVSDPQYFASLQRMAIEQDSLYAATYSAYKQNNFTQVKANKMYAESNYPLTPLMPRLLFLNAIATAKIDGQTPFIASLRDMVQRYPDNELSAMAKDMLAMMGQGMEAQQGGTTSNLTEKREANTVEAEDSTLLVKEFSPERTGKSFVYIVMEANDSTLNSVLYEVALFNFSQFLIKDFDLNEIPTFTLSQSALEIAGFDSMTDAEWYISIIQNNSDIHTILQQTNVQIIPITETNLKLINHPFSLDDYLHFIQP